MIARRHLDYVIVGQGLAGSLLAWWLMQRGRRVLVLDDGHIGAASTVAAGIVNPLAGMRFSRSPQVDLWLACARTLYDTLGRSFGRRYFYPLPMVRLFRSTKQQRFWQRRADEPQSAYLLGERFVAESSGQPVVAPHGGFHQRQTGYTDVAALVSDLRDYFLRHGAYRETRVEYAEIKTRGDEVAWQDLVARQIVFCEGHRGASNPWFDWLPFQPDRGEILTFSSSANLPNRIINGQYWLVPLVEAGFRIGATHDRANHGLKPTLEGRQKLVKGLSDMLGRALTIDIVEQRVGVRPGSADRRPFLGGHPNIRCLAIFNGFGAKGSLTIPWYVQRFAAHFEHGLPLPPEADIRRHL